MPRRFAARQIEGGGRTHQTNVAICPRPGYKREEPPISAKRHAIEMTPPPNPAPDNPADGAAAPPWTDAEIQAHVRRVVAASGTSFLSAMKMLPPARRDAMFAIYAFCREVDDIADDPAPAHDKMARLEAWREEIERLYDGRPEAPTARALAGPIVSYALDKADFLALIDGMETDAGDSLRGPTVAELERYCDRVACAVGRLSVKIFGATEAAARDVAFALGQALQLTNILRDLREDADRGRLYLPAEILDAHGIGERDADAVLAHANLGAVCDELAELARRRFREAETELAKCARRPMRPAIIMMHVYRRILDRLIRRGWRRIDEPVTLGRAEKIWIALRHGVV